MNKRNKSHCMDPTPYQAITNIEHENKKVNQLIRIIKDLLRISGFELVNRIAIRDKKTGRVYR